MEKTVKKAESESVAQKCENEDAANSEAKESANSEAKESAENGSAG